MVGFNCHSSDTRYYESQLAEFNCLLRINSTAAPDDGDLYCDAKWDGLGCWNYTKANTTSAISCPLHIQGFESGTANHYCTAEGEWGTPPPNTSNDSWADYTECVSDYVWEKVIVDMYIAGYSVSLVSLLVSLIIFNVYRRQLRSLRISMHRHLFASYTGTSVTGILYYTLVIKEVEVLLKNPWWCQFLHVFSQYFVLCNYSWMFCEGLFLHTDVVVAFGSKEKLALFCRIAGWLTPTLIIATYGLVRGLAVKDIETCWIFDSCTQWILFAPIVASLIVNVVFLLNIVRVLCTRLKNVEYADTKQSRRTAHATAVLIPLLGIQFLLFPVQPPHGTIMFKIFQTLSTIVVSFQGFFVSILFCFCNVEIMNLAKRKWRDFSHDSTLTTFFSRSKTSTTYTSVSLDPQSSHRTETSII